MRSNPVKDADNSLKIFTDNHEIHDKERIERIQVHIPLLHIIVSKVKILI